ncbi:MAG: hypothetical protein ACYCTL_07355 [Acidimicrobiales bacterium]
MTQSILITTGAQVVTRGISQAVTRQCPTAALRAAGRGSTTLVSSGTGSAAACPLTGSLCR